MKKATYLSLFTFIILNVFILVYKNSEAKSCCSGGKCTGSRYCTACKNCKYCAHCNSGGSCGVCAEYETPKSKEVTPKAKSNNSNTNDEQNATNYNNLSHNSIDGYKLVVVQSVNVRYKPTTKDSIVYVLQFGDEVKIVEVVDQIWVRIQAIGINDNYEKIAVVGYINKKFLSK